MRTKHVVVLPYDEKWKQDFIVIKNEISQALGDIAISIEHVGSTSVEGLAAKTVDEYGKIKMEAAALYPEDIDKYIEHKSSVIENI